MPDRHLRCRSNCVPSAIDICTARHRPTNGAASNSSSATTRASSLACSWLIPTRPRCLAATASGSHALWRPARILYGVNSLRCRRCRGLKYASQSEASHWRAQRKVLSIRRRVGASGDALDGPFPPMPPKMRWATYERLRAVDAALQEQWLPLKEACILRR